MGRIKVKCLLLVGVILRFRLLSGAVAELKLIYEVIDNEEQGRGVGVMRILDLELRGHLTPRFGTKDLLSRDPAIVIHKVEPTFDDIKSSLEEAISSRLQENCSDWGFTLGQYPNPQ